MLFTGENTEELQRDIARIIMENARIVMVNGKPRKILGTLLITPESGAGQIIVIPIPVNPQTSIMPTPTATVGVTTTVTWTGIDCHLTLKAPITTAADDIHKYFFIVFQGNKT